MATDITVVVHAYGADGSDSEGDEISEIGEALCLIADIIKRGQLTGSGGKEFSHWSFEIGEGMEFVEDMDDDERGEPKQDQPFRVGHKPDCEAYCRGEESCDCGVKDFQFKDCLIAGKET